MKHKAKRCGFCLQLKPIEGFKKIGMFKRCGECTETYRALKNYIKSLNKTYKKSKKQETLDLININKEKLEYANTYKLKKTSYRLGI